MRRERDVRDRRRVLIHVEMEAAMRRIAPVFAGVSLDRDVTEALSKYSEEQLAVLEDFAVKAKQMLRQAIAELREAAGGPRRSG